MVKVYSIVAKAEMDQGSMGNKDTVEWWKFYSVLAKADGLEAYG